MRHPSDRVLEPEILPHPIRIVREHKEMRRLYAFLDAMNRGRIVVKIAHAMKGRGGGARHIVASPHVHAHRTGIFDLPRHLSGYRVRLGLDLEFPAKDGLDVFEVTLILPVALKIGAAAWLQH